MCSLLDRYRVYVSKEEITSAPMWDEYYSVQHQAPPPSAPPTAIVHMYSPVDHVIVRKMYCTKQMQTTYLITQLIFYDIFMKTFFISDLLVPLQFQFKKMIIFWD